MKKVLLLLAVAGVIGFASCSKDDNNENTKANSLAGTTWVATGDEGSYQWTDAIVFNTATTFTNIYEDTDVVDNFTVSGTYAYNPPIVTLNYPYDGDSASGAISGGILTLLGDQYFKSDSYSPGNHNQGNNNNTHAPNAPTGVTATSNGSNSINVTWNAVSGATSYEVWYKIGSSVEKNLAATAYSTSFTHSGLSAGTTYYYYIKAVNDAGSSTFSPSGSATTGSNNDDGGGDGGVSIPAAPTGVSADNEGSTLIPWIKISWNSVPGATSYKLYRSNSASGNYTQIGSSTTMTSASDSNPLSNNNYYKVKAINSAGESAFSNYAFFSNNQTMFPPGAVKNLTATGTSSISLSWQTPSTGNGQGAPDNYKVYKQNPQTGSNELKTTTSNRSYYDSSPHPGINRYYVIASNSYGDGVPTPAYSTSVPLKTPTGFTASKSGSNVSFSWSKVPEATEYLIMYSSSVNGTYFVLDQINNVNTTSHTRYYPASSGTTQFFKIKARWATPNGSPAYVDSSLSSYKSITF